jgi:tetratricopeptide (TPR) repeat protein
MATNYKKSKPGILNKDYPEANSLVVDLIDSLVQQSTKAGANGRHTRAKKLLDEAKKLCTQHQNSGCMAVINKEEGKMYRAQYDDLIARSVHFSALGQGEKSKEYLSLAMTFQQLHPEYIPTSIGTDTIEGKVRVIMYREYIANARRDLQQKRYHEALLELSEARKLEQEYVFAKDDSLSALLQHAAKPLILDSLKLGQLKAWGKYYAQARHLLDTAKQMTVLYGLTGDPDIAKETAELQLKIKKGHCEKISDRYTALLKKGNLSEQMNDYYYAAIFWRQAIDTARQSDACSIDISIAQLKLKKYRYDIKYAGLLHRADSVGETNYDETFGYLVQAEQIRREHQKEMKSTKSLLTLLLVKNQVPLNIKGIRYFLEQKNAEAAYKLCKQTLESGAEVSAELQKATARLLAEYDREKQNVSPAQMAELRFGSKKELQGLKKLYLQAGW